MERKKNKSIWEKLDEPPTWAFFIIPIIIISIPIIRPIGVPIPISTYTQETYNIVNNLPDGAVVVFQHGAGAIQGDMLGPGIVAMNKLLSSKNVKVIHFCIGEVTVPYLSSIQESKPEAFGKKHGEDYVLFGFLAGGEIAIASFAADMWATYPLDYYGNPVESLPIMQEVRSADDVDLVIFSIAGCDTPDWAARQWAQAYGTPVILIIAWGCVPGALPYYPQQIQALVPDVEGGAQLEQLTGFLGRGSSFVDAKSVGGFVILAVFLGANVVMLGLKTAGSRSTRREGE